MYLLLPPPVHGENSLFTVPRTAFEVAVHAHHIIRVNGAKLDASLNQILFMRRKRSQYHTRVVWNSPDAVDWNHARTLHCTGRNTSLQTSPEITQGGLQRMMHCLGIE